MPIIQTGAGGKPSTWLPPGRLVQHHELSNVTKTLCKNHLGIFEFILKPFSECLKNNAKIDRARPLWSRYLLKWLMQKSHMVMRCDSMHSLKKWKEISNLESACTYSLRFLQNNVDNEKITYQKKNNWPNPILYC